MLLRTLAVVVFFAQTVLIRGSVYATTVHANLAYSHCLARKFLKAIQLHSISSMADLTMVASALPMHSVDPLQVCSKFKVKFTTVHTSLHHAGKEASLSPSISW